MKKHLRLIVGTLALIGAISVTPGKPPNSTKSEVVVEVGGPVVIGFFPPFTKAEEEADDGGISEGVAHLRFALEDIAKCLGDRPATYRLEVTRSITLREGKSVRRINIPKDWDHSVGIILAAPGREPETVFATAGPSSLIDAGPSAAGRYFGAPECRGSE